MGRAWSEGGVSEGGREGREGINEGGRLVGESMHGVIEAGSEL